MESVRVRQRAVADEKSYAPCDPMNEIRDSETFAKRAILIVALSFIEESSSRRERNFDEYG